MWEHVCQEKRIGMGRDHIELIQSALDTGLAKAYYGRVTRAALDCTIKCCNFAF